ncbi:MAG: hypothetical protein ACXWG1_00850 [Usitatibacter sp.]
MRKDRWRAELDAATTEHEVVNVVRDYVALLTHDEVSSLPGNVRPGLVKTGEDIAGWAVSLVRTQLAQIAQTEGVQVMREMSEFFAAAAAKITEIKIAASRKSAVG